MAVDQKLIADLLIKEYQNIAHYYPRAKELNNHRVSIEIADISSLWGQYNPQTKIIRLSQKLFYSYSWWKIVGVLKHELAHHLVHIRQDLQTVHNHSENPHGIEFQKACDDLGISPMFRRAAIDLDAVLFSEQSAQQTSAFDKIKKLMSLACSDNPYESVRATEKIQELLVKHQLRFEDSATVSEFEHLVIEFNSKRIPLYLKQIVQVLVDHFYVFAVFQPSQKMKADKIQEITIVELMGRAENLSMAEYVFHFLKEQIESELARNRNTGFGRIEAKSYAWGFIAGFSEQMSKQRQAVLNSEQKLQIHDSTTNQMIPFSANQLLERSSQQLIKYVKKIFPRLRHTGGRQRFDSNSYNQGRKKGSELRLRKVIGEKSKRIGQLLGFG